MDAINSDLTISSVLTSTETLIDDSAKHTADPTNESSIASKSAPSLQYDTLELSQAYLDYEKQNQILPTEGGTNQLHITSSVQYTQSVNGNEETMYSYELHTYPESELKDMVTDGKITRSEYHTELKRRQLYSIEE